MSLPPGAEPRAVCTRCRRPESVCYCRRVTQLDTRTRILLLQHPRERDVPIGTARIAALCLPNAELHVGVRWRDSPALARALADPSRPAVLLYPGPDAIDVVASPPKGPVTLIVVDGTWSQTRTVVRDNPELAALPRYTFTPETPSEYRIRREPHAACVSTIEALVNVLGALEGEPERWHALLHPFRAMVEAQLAYAEIPHPRRGRDRAPLPRHARERVPAWLRERANDLVCIAGEANAWSYRSREGNKEYPDELVHWVAHRLITGETFDVVIAPRNPLSPGTPVHVGLSPEVLLAGETHSTFLERWRAFARDTDVLCAWGPYAMGILASEGGYVPPTRLDVRQLARNVSRGKVGTAEEYRATLGTPPRPQLGPGRAGVRLGQLCEIVRSLVGRPEAIAA